MADIQKLNVNNTTYDISTTWSKVTGKPSTFPPESHTHSYLPLSGGAMTGNISYKGSQATYEMIRFLDNTTNGWGNGISIGGGGLTIIGAGESSTSADAYITDRNTESLYLLADDAIYLKSNAETFSNGYELKWHNGSLTVNGTPVSLNGHTHDDRYYTESEINTKLAGKSDTHSHPYLSTSGGTLSGNLHIQGTTTSTVNYDSTNPKLIFSENGTQPVAIVYNDHDVYREPAGLKVCGNQGGEWFEVAGNCYANGFYNLSGNSVSYAGHTHNYAASSHTHTKSQITDFDHTHSYLPLSGGTLTGNISYKGSQATYAMIKFINNTADTYGNGISIGGGGATLIGGGESTDQTATLLSTGGDERMIISNDQSIDFYTNCQNGIGSAKCITMDTSGAVSAPGGFFQSSDERLKTFYDPIEVDLEKLKKLRKNYFKFHDRDKLEIGISAQEIQEIYPELVSTNDEGYLSVAYDKLSVIALKAVDELNDINDKQQKEIDDLKDQLSTIKNILKEKGIL